MPYTPNFYTAVQLAVESTGAAGVVQLDAEVQKLRASIAAQQAQLAAGAPIDAKAIADFQRLTDELREATEAAEAGRRVLSGLPAALTATAGSAQGASRAILEFSRAAEDFSTGGFLGVVNNVPGVFRGIGQAAGLAGPQVMALETAASLLATTAFALYKNWDSITAVFASGTGPKLIPDLESVSKLLDELKGKQIKSLIDLADIANAEKLVGELTKIRSAYQSLDAPSKDQAERGKRFAETVRESGGRDAVTKSVIDSELGPESPEVQAVRKKIAEADALISEAKKIGDAEQVEQYERDKSRLENTKEGQRSTDRQNRVAAVQDRIGRAATGDDTSIRYIADLLGKNSAKFAGNGVDVAKFEAGLSNSDQRSIEEERRQKTADAAFKPEQERATKELDAKQKQDKADEQEDEFYRKTEIENQGIRSKAIDKMDDFAANNQEKAAKQRAAAQASQAKQLGAGYIPQIESAFAENQLLRSQGAPLAGNQKQSRYYESVGQPFARTDTAMRAEVERQVAAGLHASGQNPALAPDIVTEAIKKFNADASRNFAQTGDQGTALIAVIDQTQTTMQQALNGMAQRDAQIAQLHGQNAQLQNQNQQLGINAQRLNSMQRRSQQQRPTLNMSYP